MADSCNATCSIFSSNDFLLWQFTMLSLKFHNLSLHVNIWTVDPMCAYIIKLWLNQTYCFVFRCWHLTEQLISKVIKENMMAPLGGSPGVEPTQPNHPTKQYP